MRILCLHGYGTNADIMKRQMSALMKYSDPGWEFYFLEAKVECPAAPGLSDVFPGPFLCWSRDFTPTSNRAAHDLIHETFTREGLFDGVFGFSQGASVMAAYLLEQATSHPDKSLPVRFAIFCSPAPILSADPAYIQSIYGTLSQEDLQRLRSGRGDQIAQLPHPVRGSANLLQPNLAAMAPVHRLPLSAFFDRPPSDIPCVVDPDVYTARICIPTLHVCGANDPPSMQGSAALCESFCDSRWRRSFRHASVHNLPRVPGEAKEMVSLMEWVMGQSQLARL